MIRSLPANLVRPPKPASPRRTGSGGNTGNALAVPRGQARQSGEPAFAAPLGFSDTPYPRYVVKRIGRAPSRCTGRLRGKETRSRHTISSCWAKSEMAKSTSSSISELAGKIRGWWYVVRYEGQFNGVHHWRCMCRNDRVEKVVPQPEVLNKRINALHQGRCRCRIPPGNLAGCIFGEWTVLGKANESDADLQALDEPGLRWKCRCRCGCEKEISTEELNSWRTLSCGCVAYEEVRLKLRPNWIKATNGFHSAWLRASEGFLRRRYDEWSPEMESALQALQPACVICGAAEDLVTDHVIPISQGLGLKPGNAVRLCRKHNSIKHDKQLGELSAEMASKIEKAAAEFKDHWYSRTSAPRSSQAAAPRDSPASR
jgi:5-methylcytosine-specific restriction endonuclease McrA